MLFRDKPPKAVWVVASTVLKVLVATVEAKPLSVAAAASNVVFTGSLLLVQWKVTLVSPVSPPTKAMVAGAAAKVAVEMVDAHAVDTLL